MPFSMGRVRASSTVLLLMVACVLLLTTQLASAALNRRCRTTQEITMVVSLGKHSPDCNFTRTVIFTSINGGPPTYQPTITTFQGRILKVKVVNNIPASFFTVSPGIAIHWHGLAQKGSQWYDGVPYITQCPITTGTNFTYVIPVNDPPGTYMWHDHSAATRGDGLQGMLIVKPCKFMPTVTYRTTLDRTVLVNDWFWRTGPEQAIGLNRPFDLNKTTPTSGVSMFTGLPQAILVNGKGNKPDCAPPVNGSTTCAVATAGPSCRERVPVSRGKTYRFRLANLGTLLMVSVCIEGHNITVVEADARPVEPFKAPVTNGYSCVDVNAGQRYDVLLKADQPRKNYWIAILGQGRPGAPAAYAVLSYTRSSALPATPYPQPGSIPMWTPQYYFSTVQTRRTAFTSAVEARKMGLNGTLELPSSSWMTFGLNLSQPLLQSTGQIRWAFNNIVQTTTPGCTDIMSKLYKDKLWLGERLAEQKRTSTLINKQKGKGSHVLIGDKPLFVPTPNFTGPDYPMPSMHVGVVGLNSVIDVIVQNNAASSFNGDYRGVVRTAMEQHPIHLHGQHFWVLGYGTGNYHPKAFININTVNPSLRDTVTLYPGTWIAIRFKASNPGFWGLHCHIQAHMMMGQNMYMYVGTASRDTPPPPADLPACPAECMYSLAPFANTTTWTPAADAPLP